MPGLLDNVANNLSRGLEFRQGLVAQDQQQAATVARQQLGQRNQDLAQQKFELEQRALAEEAKEEQDFINLLDSTKSSPKAMAELAVRFPERFEQINKNLGIISQQQKDEAADFAFMLRQTPFGERQTAIDARAASINSQPGRSANETLELGGLSEADQNRILDTVQISALSPSQRSRISSGEALTSSQREFGSLTAGLSDEQKSQATLIKLGLSPRAVGSAIQTIASEGLADEIGNAESTIKERAKFGELKGAARSKRIDSAFDSVEKVTKNITNLDKAIAAVRGGAAVGGILGKFPSLRDASVLLDQIQGELALDVIGDVTFGALSAGELSLAKEIALPTGLTPDRLILHIERRQRLQEKLKSYFIEQIEFLEDGGSVAGFLRKKEREKEGRERGATDQTPQADQIPQADQTPNSGRFSVVAK